MYSQQEYDMVRRQTMQIEAEKRVLLKWALLGVTVMLAASVILTSWMFRRYITADNLIKAADEKSAAMDTQLQKVTRELAEKTAILEKSSGELAKQNEVISTIVPKLVGKTASPNEINELAKAIYQQPGHVVELPGIPPDNVLKTYRVRVDGRTHKYVLVAGQIDGKWVLYSLLLRNQGE